MRGSCRSDPFADRARYALFVQAQSVFHRDIDALYRDAGLAEMLPARGAAATSADRAGI